MFFKRVEILSYAAAGETQTIWFITFRVSTRV